VDKSCKRRQKRRKSGPDAVKTSFPSGTFAWSLVAPGHGEEACEDPVQCEQRFNTSARGKIMFRATQNIVTGNIADLSTSDPREIAEDLDTARGQVPGKSLLIGLYRQA